MAGAREYLAGAETGMRLGNQLFSGIDAYFDAKRYSDLMKQKEQAQKEHEEDRAEEHKRSYLSGAEAVAMGVPKDVVGEQPGPWKGPAPLNEYPVAKAQLFQQQEKEKRLEGSEKTKEDRLAREETEAERHNKRMEDIAANRPYFGEDPQLRQLNRVAANARAIVDHYTTGGLTKTPEFAKAKQDYDNAELAVFRRQKALGYGVPQDLNQPQKPLWTAYDQ